MRLVSSGVIEHDPSGDLFIKNLTDCGIMHGRMTGRPKVPDR